MRVKVLLLSAMIITFLSITDICAAYWIWTPGTGKFINPKHAVRETPEKQFDWAMEFFKAGDCKKAIAEFDKLLKHYPQAKLAADAQFYIAQSYENAGEYYTAFENYQKVIDKYPYSKSVEEVIEREYRIGNLFYSGQKTRILGVALLPSKDKAIQVFGKVIENSPYGKYADIAQFKMGQCYMETADYVNAALAFKGVVENHPKSLLVDDAKYQIALCAASSAGTVEYNEEDTDKALEAFEDFVQRYPDSSMEGQARSFISRLEEERAEKNFNIAQFYERQGNAHSAVIYYEEIVDTCPAGSKWVSMASEKLETIRKK